MPIIFEHDEAKKKELSTKFFDVDFKTFLGHLSSYMKANNGSYLTGSEVNSDLKWINQLLRKKTQKQHYVVFQLTYADLVFACVMESMDGKVGEKCKELAPELGQLNDRINQLPNIKKWRETRPQV